MLWLASVAALLLLAGVLGSSAGAKLLTRASFRQFRNSLPATLGVPVTAAGPLAVASVAAEALLATSLVAAVFVPALVGPAVVATVGLLGVFTGALVVMIRRGVRQSCHCFGAGDHPPTWRDVVRNGLLLAVAAVPTLAGSPPPPDLTSIGANVPHLPGILAVLAAVVVLNTVLVVLVLRNQREQTRLLRLGHRAAEPEPIMMESGDRVRPFTATTVDGQTLTRASLVGETLVAFVSPTCPACAESLPGFLARAEEVGERDRVLAVVLGPEDATAPLAERLAPVARVVTEPEHGPLSRAFGVTGYPAFALLHDHTVVSSHFLLEKIPVSSAR